MRCPFCGQEDTQVKDSRSSEDGMVIRRRRFCPSCKGRFTTFERIQLKELSVIKRNGESRPFDREKLTRSISIAVRKRLISEEKVEEIVNHIIRTLEEGGESEVPTSMIGEMVMKALAKLDEVAYVRFASVYKDFANAKDFERFLKDIDDGEED